MAFLLNASKSQVGAELNRTPLTLSPLISMYESIHQFLDPEPRYRCVSKKYLRMNNLQCRFLNSIILHLSIKKK